MAHTCFNKCFVPPSLAVIIINDVDPNTETIGSYARRQMSSFRVKDETLDPEIRDAGKSLSLGILDSSGRASGGINGRIIQHCADFLSGSSDSLLSRKALHLQLST